MKWTECAITDLRKYAGMKESLKNIPEKIRVLEIRFQSVKGASSDSTPVQGGGSHMEDAMLDNIVERERLKILYQADSRMVKLVEKGLQSLSEEEKTVLDLFYINRSKNYLDELSKRLGYEQAQIYRLKGNALYKFTVTMYGILEY
jgi:DNA-directed RNA polymerase specialized sigma subunit